MEFSTINNFLIGHRILNSASPPKSSLPHERVRRLAVAGLGGLDPDDVPGLDAVRARHLDGLPEPGVPGVRRRQPLPQRARRR